MPRKTAFEEGHEEGFNLACEEHKTLTLEEYGRIALRLAEDSQTSHENVGLILYKLNQFVKN